MRLAFGSARSAPGVTTAVLACASVWRGRVLVVEAAEDGGVAAARFGLAVEPGLTTLAAALRTSSDPTLLWDHVQPLPGTDGRVQVLVAPSSAEPAHAAWRAAADRVGELLATQPDEVTVLIDVGRLPVQPVTGAVVSCADRLLLVVRPRLEDLHTALARLPVLRALGPPVELLLVGERPYGPDEVASTLRCPVAGVVADDRRAADALAGLSSARRLDRSPLVRSAAVVVDRLGPDPTLRLRPDLPVAPDRAPSVSVAEP